MRGEESVGELKQEDPPELKKEARQGRRTHGELRGDGASDRVDLLSLVEDDERGHGTDGAEFRDPMSSTPSASSSTLRDESAGLTTQQRSPPARRRRLEDRDELRRKKGVRPGLRATSRTLVEADLGVGSLELGEVGRDHLKVRECGHSESAKRQ